MVKKRRKLKRETESLLIETESLLIFMLLFCTNNNINTKYVEAEIDKMQQNSRCRTCGDRD